jgi:hypothetical protein
MVELSNKPAAISGKDTHNFLLRKKERILVHIL